MFNKKFGEFVCVGEFIEFNKGDYVVRATVVYDEDSTLDDQDTWNTDQSVTGCNDEQQAELLAARKAFENNEWRFCGVVLSVWLGKSIRVQRHVASLFGIELNYPGGNDLYLNEVAEELATEAAEEIDNVIAKFKRLAAE